MSYTTTPWNSQPSPVSPQEQAPVPEVMSGRAGVVDRAVAQLGRLIDAGEPEVMHAPHISHTEQSWGQPAAEQPVVTYSQPSRPDTSTGSDYQVELTAVHDAYEQMQAENPLFGKTGSDHHV